MEFNVLRGSSNICHIEVYPLLPVNGDAQPWKMIENSGQEVDSLEVWFSAVSTRQQRQSERMVFVFNISETVQSKDVSWRFASGGLMYCETEADYLDNISLETTDNGKTLIATFKCLTDTTENFNFSFLAIYKENASGECRVLASADPGGSNGRR
ncbi:MAG: hypothetical protein AB8B81_21225 [Halioglobus sp.]